MKKSILIIEDDDVLGEMYQTILSQEGYPCVWAKDGPEGLEKVKDKPDFIFLDIMMPKMNGLDVIKHLKADETTKHIPVVMLSNLAQQDIVSQCLAQGATGYLLKVNLLPSELISTIENYFANPNAPINNLTSLSVSDTSSQE